jgi:hypothetical protein
MSAKAGGHTPDACKCQPKVSVENATVGSNLICFKDFLERREIPSRRNAVLRLNELHLAVLVSQLQGSVGAVREHLNMSRIRFAPENQP